MIMPDIFTILVSFLSFRNLVFSVFIPSPWPRCDTLNIYFSPVSNIPFRVPILSLCGIFLFLFSFVLPFPLPS